MSLKIRSVLFSAKINYLETKEFGRIHRGVNAQTLLINTILCGTPGRISADASQLEHARSELLRVFLHHDRRLPSLLKVKAGS